MGQGYTQHKLVAGINTVYESLIWHLFWKMKGKERKSEGWHSVSWLEFLWREDSRGHWKTCNQWQWRTQPIINARIMEWPLRKAAGVEWSTSESSNKLYILLMTELGWRCGIVQVLWIPEACETLHIVLVCAMFCFFFGLNWNCDLLFSLGVRKHIDYFSIVQEF